MAASFPHHPSPLAFGSLSPASDSSTAILLALSASFRHSPAHPPLPPLPLSLSCLHLLLSLQLAPPPLALSTLPTLSASPSGCVVALPPLTLPTSCSRFLVSILASLRNCPTSNLLTWLCRTGTVSSPTLARPRRSSPLLTSTLSSPSDSIFGTVTGGLSTGGSIFFVHFSTLRPALPVHVAPTSCLHPPLHPTHPPCLPLPAPTLSLIPRTPPSPFADLG